MIDSTIDDQAPNPASEIAEIEKAVGSETESAQQTGDQERSAFDKLAEVKNFESVDDLVKAYENLESKMNPTMKELKELKEMVKGIQEANKPEERDIFDDLPEEQREAVNLLEKLLDRQLKSKLSPLLKKLEVEEASNEIKKVREQFPGINDEELGQAVSIMEKYPKMSLDEAVKIASYDRASKSAMKRTENAQKTKRTFTESASTARQGDDTDYSKMTLEELEEMIGVPSSRR